MCNIRKKQAHELIVYMCSRTDIATFCLARNDISTSHNVTRTCLKL